MKLRVAEEKEEALDEALDRLLPEEPNLAYANFLPVAQRYGWQTYFYPADALAHVSGMANPSSVVEQSVGTPGVSEPAALLAAQTDQLLAPKHVMSSPAATQRMTFALARSAAVSRRTTRWNALS